jgi:hypothetical protein
VRKYRIFSDCDCKKDDPPRVARCGMKMPCDSVFNLRATVAECFSMVGAQQNKVDSLTGEGYISHLFPQEFGALTKLS